MATKVWKGFLNFGLVTIPVYLNTGARGESVSLNTFHEPCGSRVRMPKFCDTCNKQIPPEEIVKGYANGDSYVPITKEELESIAPASDRTMEIRECVEADKVDPIYLAESFYLLPDDAGRKAYSLLVQALADSGRCAIAQLTKSNREHIVLLRPRENGLVAHFLYFENEVNRVPEFESLKQIELSKAEHKMAAQLVDDLAAPFEPGQYEDGYSMRLNALIASKLDKNTPAPKPIKSQAPASMDLSAALAASLGRPKRKITLDEEPAAPKKAGAGKKGRRVA
jgi:DNA end-binding protein Ku